MEGNQSACVKSAVMGLKRHPLYFLSVLALSVGSFCLPGCAVVRAPTGGPRDTIPPHLLGSIPANYTRNFRGSEIILLFDEFVKIKDQSSSVFISPEPEKPAEIKVRKKTIHINFKSPVEPNRTYSINFGNSIVDNNEGNVLHNFRFVFSTGIHIDSLKISGHVFDPLDTTSKKDVFVILHHASNDSAIYKSKPLLYTTTDKEGNFELSNIGAGNYNLYALEELNKNKKYDNKSESIAFLNTPIHLVKDTLGLTLNLFKERENGLRILARKIAGGLLKVELNKPTDRMSFKWLNPTPNGVMKVEKNASGDTTFLWLPSQTLDSVKVAILEHDKEVLRFTQNNFVKNKNGKNLTLGDNITNGLLAPGKTLTLRFSEPLLALQSKNYLLTEDSIPIQPDSLINDTQKIRQYAVYFPWEAKHKYQLTLKKNTIQSIYGGYNSEYKTRWTVGSERNYGTIILKLTVPQTGSFIIYLLDQQFKILDTRTISQNTSLTFKYLNPGKFRFRVVYDKNANKIFDTGNLAKKLQPEKVVNSREISLRANEELNAPFNLPRL